jgi:murein DD-endopeptidase MepM/ murein hydrolase activator NlpD
MIFTAHVDDNGITKPLFSPMDPITIYLQRVRGRPVRVFTGFLDRTPYLQLYPGVIQLKASCTLKRLLYTYFDPALPYTQTFLSAYGWIPLGNGTAVSSSAYNEFLSDGKADPLADPQKKEVDGSLANLLYATLKHIGRWNTKDVYIEPLSEQVFVRLLALSDEFAKDNKETQKKFKELLQKLAGSSSYGSQDGITPLPPGTGREIQASVFAPGDAGGTFACAGTKFPGGEIPGGSPPPPGMYYAELSTPAGSESYDAMGRIFGASPSDPYGGVAPAQPARITYNGKSVIARKADRGNGGASQPKIDLWYTTAAALGFDGIGKVKVELLTEDQVKELENDPGGLGGDLPGGLPADAADTTDTTTRSPTKGGSNKDTTGDNGKWAYPLGRKADSEGTVADHMSRPLGNWQSDNAVDLMCPPGVKWIAVEDGKISSSMGWGESSGSGTVYGYRLHLEGKSGNTYFYQHGASNIAPQGKEVKKGDVIGEVGAFNNGIPTHLHFASQPPTNPETVIKEGNVTAGGGDATGSPSGGQSADSNAGALGAMFFGQIEWPSMLEQSEAALLGGEKSLLNDKPLLPFIQQLCNASLRHFQSLPDGRFYAFFPDYFGEFNAHPPYWEIDDIEVLDGNIELNDDALVTHMYVIGDTINPTTGGSPFLLRAMGTGGVVTVFNMFMADSVLNRTEARQRDKDKAEKKASKEEKKLLESDPGGMGILLDRKEVVTFLERYGVRPLVEDMPFIRSPYYEMFLAYQKFLLAWSRQFATPFTFTFMPELFPGGKVGFPQHGLQMYIEETSHSWDYESGFTTTATLSAPSVYAVDGNEAAVNLLPPNMVNAIIEPSKAKK